MATLKLPKYLTMPDGSLPVTGLAPGDVAEKIILTNFRDHVARAEKRFSEISHRRINTGWEVDTITGVIDGTRLTVCCAGIGSGQTSNVMEELIQLGGTAFVQLGATGAMQPHLELGDVVIPTGSVRDEGTTRYYAPPQYPAVADPVLVHELVEAAKKRDKTVYAGIVRTTDGFYPSQRIEEYVESYSRLGVLSVEQEVAAILTIAATSGCRAGASLLVIGNLVTGTHSFNGDRTDLLEHDWFEQFDIALDALRALDT